MEYKLLEEQDVLLMNRFVDDMHTQYNEAMLGAFLQDGGARGFVAKEDDKIFGFAYGYILIKPDGRKDFYFHAIDVMKEYQGNGYGTGLMQYITDYVQSIGCRKLFLVTNTSNVAACRCYEKAGGRVKELDDVVYVFEGTDI